ncbi:hypothetical protein CHLNCDRAFT_145588 [Chlorella variabilis]|uniref:Rieske domain-containing protein n=1 Tax=Chlorella variabilis TaxID=554065 RepID=E1ZDT3_CHLVA|nr:hypothetical protein CHLNCDRAFT_145588 [Chlorella variabilis]EFN56079.1 hypothetical protein CHLNCDRAFT_145588 [Chlorella variabilis]|eukprot:XP_005848181.1 hypothetical protein CHLNCDRAFT_145588 [Chlorella variabilis]
MVLQKCSALASGPAACCPHLGARRPFAGARVARSSTRPAAARSRRQLAPAATAEAQAPPAPPAFWTATPAPAPPSQEEQPEQPEATFNWFDQWYPIAYVKDIPDDAPYGFVLLEQPIVIWKDGGGAYRCLRDACPHRLVPLSDGRIAPNGELQCPYHGWQFKGCGTCTLMPQGGDPTAPRAAATAYQCAVKQGLVWVKLQPAPTDGSEPDTSSIHTIPELDKEGWFAFGDMWRDIPYDWATLIENVVDCGHVPFTHHGERAALGVLERGQFGFQGVWPTGPRKGALGAQHTRFEGPVLMRHTIDAFDTRGFGNITAVYGVPVAPGRCRAIVRQPFRFKNKLLPLAFKVMPAFLGHLGNNSVLDEDNIFLHMQARACFLPAEQESVRRGMGEKPAGQVYYMPAASDAYVSAFRNWMKSVAGGGPFGPMNADWLRRAGPRLSDEQLLDHYHSHTKRCSVCQPALRNVRLARAVSAAVGVSAAAMAAMALMIQLAAPLAAGSPQALLSAAAEAVQQGQGLVHLAGGCAAVAVVAFAVWSWCSKTIPRFFSGTRPHARNRVVGEYSP